MLRDVKDFVIKNSKITSKNQNMEILEGENVVFDNVKMVYQ